MPKKKSGPLGIGIIGAGLMGGIHAQCYAGEKGCRLIGCCDVKLDSAKKLAESHDATAYASLEELLADPRIDAVSVTTPQAFHAEQIIAAARAGKHIFSEKPLALTPKELDAIEAAVRKAGVTMMVGHQLRHHPVIKQVKRHLKKLGRLYHMDLEWTLLIKGHTGRCWESYRLGGFFMELGCHMTDLARFLFGPIQHVSGNTLRLNPKRVTEDHTVCLLEFETAATGVVTVSANHRTKRQGLIMGRVLGEKGRIDFTVYPYGRSFNKATLTVDHGKEIFKPDTTVQQLEFDAPPSAIATYPGFYDVYEQEVKAFLKSVRTGTPPPCTLEDGRSAIEVILATYHEQGKATKEKNFAKRPKTYRSDASCHPLLGG